MNLKDSTRRAMLECYKYQGLAAVKPKALEIMRQCESNVADFKTRCDIKGELAEVVLECYLMYVQKTIAPSILSKGLCIRNKNNGNTTEMDVCFFTPIRIYMFECKSYSGKKALTKECTLTNKTTSKDVYGQSLHHMTILNQYLTPYRTNVLDKGQSPYRLVLFELSSTECEDKRELKWKKAIPLVTLDNLEQFILNEFSTSAKINWDTPRMLPILQMLDKQSERNFKEHLKRLGAT
ncbi:MAG: NERD domain-containing protein [Clostridia bacterium]